MDVFQILLHLLGIFVGVLANSTATRCPNAEDMPDSSLVAAYDRKCFQFVHAEKFWEDARDHCWRHGGHLVKVDSKEINRFLVDTLDSLTYWKNYGIWIGLQDRDTEMQWEWVTSDPHITEALDAWSNWDSGQPGSMLHKLKNCVRMVRRRNWQWHETPCRESFFKYRFVCEYEPDKMIITPSAKVMAQVFSNGNLTRMRQQPSGLVNQKGGQPDAIIPGARRSSPFTRGRQHSADGVKVADRDAATNSNGNADLHVGDEDDVQNGNLLSVYWRYFLVIGFLCVFLVLAFSFMLAVLLVRLWRVRHVDSVRTIESLAKNRIWRALNTRDTDNMYDSRNVVFPKASWENEYILDDSRAYSGAKGNSGMSATWQPTASGQMVDPPTWLAVDSENSRNAERESAELLVNGKSGEEEEHIYESIDEVRRGVDALNMAATAASASENI